MELLGSRMMRKYHVRFQGGRGDNGKGAIATSPASYPTRQTDVSWDWISGLSIQCCRMNQVLRLICA